jgi:DNA end-binding protein Ku
MANPLWKGSISFGLVEIPVDLYSAENTSRELSFHMLDKRDMRPIRYERVNRDSGEPVAWEQIVKGYEYDKGQYIIITPEDFKRANVEATETIDIVDFVDASQVKPMFFEKPYFLAPSRKGTAGKAYALLRETLRRTGKAGVAKVVIRTRQHLGAVMVEGDVLMLNTLRFAGELRKADFEVPGEDLTELGVTDREIQMAERLVEGMAADWEPGKYHDQYTDDLLALIEDRARKGQIEAVEGPAPERKGAEGVIDIMELLKRSVEKAEGGRKTPARPKPLRKAAPRAAAERTGRKKAAGSR